MIIDGRQIAAEILARTKKRAEKLTRRPKVVAYVPSDTPATRSYLRIKQRYATEAGCDFKIVADIAEFAHADACIIQLPLPPGISDDILNSIPLEKDADVLSKIARERFERGDADALLPPVAAAVREILLQNNISIREKKVVVIGKGWLVGGPVAIWLKNQGADVVVAIKDSGDLGSILSGADIIVSGAGSPHLITPEMIKDGVVIIDAGTSESNGALQGDADPACAAKCSLFTPVPGGVGPIAVACLFANAVILAERQQG